MKLTLARAEVRETKTSTQGLHKRSSLGSKIEGRKS